MVGLVFLLEVVVAIETVDDLVVAVVLIDLYLLLVVELLLVESAVVVDQLLSLFEVAVVGAAHRLADVFADGVDEDGVAVLGILYVDAYFYLVLLIGVAQLLGLKGYALEVGNVYLFFFV